MKSIITTSVLTIVFLFSSVAFGQHHQRNRTKNFFNRAKGHSQAQTHHKRHVHKDVSDVTHRGHGHKDVSDVTHRGHGPTKAQREVFMKKFDVNGDGKLCDKEKMAIRKAFEAKRAAFMKKFDVNKDGKLCDKEKMAIRKAFEVRHNKGGPPQGHRPTPAKRPESCPHKTMSPS